MAKKILIADDDRGYLSMITAMLSGRGYSVATAHDGEEALKQAQTLIPDLIILDVSMPKIDGDQVYMMLKARDTVTNKIPILIVTGLRTEKELEETKEENVLAKPVHLDQLLLHIKRLIGD